MRVLAAGAVPVGFRVPVWVAREYTCGGTLYDELQRRGRLPLDEALGIFTTCCQAVSWLDGQHVYRWSAHARNVLKFEDGWKIGDLGRAVLFLPIEHPAFETRRAQFRGLLDSDESTLRRVVAFLDRWESWGHPASGLVWPYDEEIERRLRLDDCAMLGGLLCELLTGKKWMWFCQALESRPLCSAVYGLTGDRRIDERLSAVLNACWRGDAGGVPLVANLGLGDQSTYEDSRAVLQHAQAALADSAGGQRLAA